MGDEEVVVLGGQAKVRREDQAGEVVGQEDQVKEQKEDLAEEEMGLLVNLVED